MNIFYVDSDPAIAAQSLNDKHVVKMILESAQLLCAAFPKGTAPYKKTHVNHPSSLWTRATKSNFMWLVSHALAMCEEYTYRYGKTHKSQNVIMWCVANIERAEFSLSKDWLTPMPQCMPEQYKVPGDSVAAYRAYYIGDKARFSKWTKRNPPEWFLKGIS